MTEIPNRQPAQEIESAPEKYWQMLMDKYGDSKSVPEAECEKLHKMMEARHGEIMRQVRTGDLPCNTFLDRVAKMFAPHAATRY